MKYLLLSLMAGVFIACNDKSATSPAGPPLVIQDSGLIRNKGANPYIPIDVSPMDMIYLPKDYTVLKMSGKTSSPPVARIIYSRPHRQGRKIFGSLVKWGQPWRLGANEATELQLFSPVTIEGKKIPEGRYVLYCIPQPKEWTIIFNSKTDSWGLHQDSTKDLYKFTASAKATAAPVEYFSMEFDTTSAGADLVMAWDEVEARLPIIVTAR
jgi:hypothetical protein